LTQSFNPKPPGSSEPDMTIAKGTDSPATPDGVLGDSSQSAKPDRWRTRPFDPASTDPQHVIAEALARREDRTFIPPGCWWEAGAVVKALKAKGLLVDRRTLKRGGGS
jgi:hypothetical protein